MQDAIDKLRFHTQPGSALSSNNNNSNDNNSPDSNHSGYPSAIGGTSLLRSSIGMVPLKVIKSRAASIESHPNEFIAAMVKSSVVSAANQNYNNNNSADGSSPSSSSYSPPMNQNYFYSVWPSGITPPRKQCRVWGLENYDEILKSGIADININNANNSNSAAPSTSPNLSNSNNDNNNVFKSWTAEPIVRSVIRAVVENETKKEAEEVDKVRSEMRERAKIQGSNKSNDLDPSVSPSPIRRIDENRNDTTPLPKKNDSSPSPAISESKKKPNVVVNEGINSNNNSNNKVDPEALLKKIENIVSDSEKEKLQQAKKKALQEEQEREQQKKAEQEKIALATTNNNNNNNNNNINNEPIVVKIVTNSDNNNNNNKPKPVVAEANPNDDDEKQKLINFVLKVHNDFRRKHFAVSLQYDAACESSAQKCADRCAQIGKMEHAFYDAASTTNGQRQGQNIYWNSVKARVDTAVEAWYSELVNPGYDFDEGKAMKDGGMIGHVTQLLWRSTTKVGAAFSSCGKYFVCNYYPAGNVTGKYKENVKAK